ncbi:MAG TPA: efflux RND transporter permease subunit [Epsilonproteobacteria bacterium]|nr:efflux RND transporter permease subunit [Campylobacterota bacterium]
MKRFEKFIKSILENRAKKKIVLIATAVLFLLSLLMFPTKIVLAKMLPGKSDNTFSIYIDAPAGSSVVQTKEVATCAMDILQEESQILHMELFLAHGIPLDYAGLVKGSGMKQTQNVAEISVNLTDKKTRKEPSYLMVQRLRPIVQEACEGIVDGTSIKFVEQPAGPPTMASVVVEVHGQDNAKISQIALQVASILSDTKGLVDVDILGDKIYQKYSLELDKERAARSGLDVAQVNQMLYLAFEGMVVGYKNTPDSTDQIPIFLVLDSDSKSLHSSSKEALYTKLSSLEMMNQSGMLVPLSQLVTIKEVDSSPIIMHKNLSRMANVIAETDMVSQVYPLLDARAQMIEYFSDDYVVTKEPGMSTYMFDLHLEDKKTGEKFLLRWDGEMKVTLDTFRDLGGAFIAALVLIFLLLVVYYKSFVLSGTVLLGSFLSIIGVIFGHLVADIVTRDTFFLTATSLIGFIALMGISSRNSLLLIDFAKSLMIDHGIEKKQAIAIASATRAKPIALTAIAIILGSTLLAGDPIFGGLGVALISGTVAAVFVSLLFVPILMDNSKAMDFTPIKNDRSN